MTSNPTDPPTLEPQLALEAPISDADHVRGDAGAAITLLEYGDFGCPFCAQAHPVVETLLNERRGALRFVFRHNPRRGEPSVRAARAAEAAGLQGQFWSMHDTLFQHAPALEESDLLSYAVALKLDTVRFRTDLLSAFVATLVRNSELSGIRSHVIGTPTFFINGHRFVDRPEVETLARAIDSTSGQGSSR